MSPFSRLRTAFRRPDDDTLQRQRVYATTAFPSLSTGVIDAFFDNFGYTIPLSLLQQLVDLCRITRPALAVEIGSGASTRALNEVLAEHDGLLVSIEEDGEWIGRTIATLERPELVVFLAAARADGSGINHAAVEELVRGRTAGVLLIDGPATRERFDHRAVQLFERLVDPPNSSAARTLAEKNSLTKFDFGDPIYQQHQYSFLLPAGMEPPPSAGRRRN